MNRNRVPGAFAFLALLCWPAEAQRPDEPEARVRLERVAGGTILVRDVTGDYAQHPKVFGDLMRIRDRNYQPVGDCFGIYPIDPDAVDSPSELKWRIGVRVVPQAPQKDLQPAPAGYRLETLPGAEAAVLDTTVSDAATDGLALIRWMVEQGFVQRGPTRMEYRSHEGTPMLIPARIIVPVRRRPSGLRLAPRPSDSKTHGPK